MKTKPPPGTRVRLTGEFLRNTGQQAGGEGQKSWTIVSCGCGLCKDYPGVIGSFVALDEMHLHPEDGPRHIHIANIELDRRKGRSS